ncbi:MAG: hypothetical protein MK364_18035, partial [Pirellulales bacterium]|nr:hypothetical protein [Pirellulales bacterium]
MNQPRPGINNALESTTSWDGGKNAHETHPFLLKPGKPTSLLPTRHRIRLIHHARTVHCWR